MKQFITLFSMCFLSFILSAQIDTTIISRTSTSLQINEDPNADWKSGKAKYPAKPRHVWELGLHGGHFILDGDVDSKRFFSGYGLGLHLRRALHYAFSVRFDAFYGLTKGLEPQPYGESLEPEQFYTNHKGDVREVFNGYNRTNPWFPAFKTSYFNGSVQGILNIGNLLFHKETNKWNSYIFVGAGLDHNITKLNLRDASGNEYSNLVTGSGFTYTKFNSRDGRKEIKSALENIYDDTYETESYKKAGIFRLGDDVNIHFGFNGGVGLSRKITKRLNLSLEHEIIVTDNDYLDGIHWRTATDQTNQNDILHYTNLRLGINLGNLNKKAEPLYWLNPIDAAYSDIAELKQRPKFDLTDTDNDGVIDMLDKDNTTPPGAPVNTKGELLDSDGDKVPDHVDPEPYSPPGFPINEKGVAQIPQGITEAQVNKLLENRFGPFNPADSAKWAKGGMMGGGPGCCKDWFLPMIHFNLDEYCIKPQYLGHIHSVAEVMQTNPDLKITVHGHTDIRHSNAYNNVLSFNRAKEVLDYLLVRYNFPRERFVLMYGGEETPIVADLGKRGVQTKHYINRRVEFRIANDKDKDMSKPEGPDAGSCNKARTKKLSGSSNVKSSFYGADFCAYLKANPNSHIADEDCDGGGVPNSIECAKGSDPFDAKDDCDPKDKK